MDQHTYVTIDDLIAFVRQKISFCVVDHFGKDITNLCLVSAIFELSKRGILFNDGTIREIILGKHTPSSYSPKALEEYSEEFLNFLE